MLAAQLPLTTRTSSPRCRPAKPRGPSIGPVPPAVRSSAGRARERPASALGEALDRPPEGGQHLGGELVRAHRRGPRGLPAERRSDDRGAAPRPLRVVRRHDVTEPDLEAPGVLEDQAGQPAGERRPEAGEGRLRRRARRRARAPRRSRGHPGAATHRIAVHQSSAGADGRLMPTLSARSPARSSCSRRNDGPGAGRRSGIGGQEGFGLRGRRRRAGSFAASAACFFASISASIAASSRRSISSRTSFDGGSTWPPRSDRRERCPRPRASVARRPGLIREALETAAGSIWVTPRMSSSTASRSDAPQDGHFAALAGTLAEHHGQVSVAAVAWLGVGGLGGARRPASCVPGSSVLASPCGSCPHSHSIVAGGFEEMS